MSYSNKISDSPQLGDIKVGRAIGIQSGNKFVYVKCEVPNCEVVRWVQLRAGVPVTKFCRRHGREQGEKGLRGICAKGHCRAEYGYHDSVGRRRCRLCESNRHAKYREANRDKIRASGRLYNASRPEKVYEATIRMKYGMGLDDYGRLLEQQEGCCAICRNKPNGRRLAVDHDHVSGDVRGLLCPRCNYVVAVVESGLGQRAEAYLLTHELIRGGDDEPNGSRGTRRSSSSAAP